MAKRQSKRTESKTRRKPAEEHWRWLAAIVVAIVMLIVIWMKLIY